MPKVADIKTVKECTKCLSELDKLYTWQSRTYKDDMENQVALPVKITRAFELLNIVGHQVRKERARLTRKENCLTMDRLHSEILLTQEEFKNKATREKADKYLKAIMDIYGSKIPSHGSFAESEFHPYGYVTQNVEEKKEFLREGIAWVDALKHKLHTDHHKYLNRAYHIITRLANLGNNALADHPHVPKEVELRTALAEATQQRNREQILAAQTEFRAARAQAAPKTVAPQSRQPVRTERSEPESTSKADSSQVPSGEDTSSDGSGCLSWKVLALPLAVIMFALYKATGAKPFPWL